ncbi:1-(5-phosphoribosyl)-5-amino-4-imidazole-car boxylate carboxylase [Micractinium conductrix]|uniref:phosphoribosylaminoimidazole carboxylase n=1 Tax=Micractinium conductrix TaxID=554055 RepID=A0A2P6VEC0_9CHLO|nr:1-(5-phosphoribosyl)-5-amino-4-imidazole-car boxylate carboxylase [Micractinium conductrix]|eukprot:PSC72428.1 1-(5-phosphoribosyl)-5-amino-4-imidazole-car boxylate carboxylase [Micractinium conductrix]
MVAAVMSMGARATPRAPCTTGGARSLGAGRCALPRPAAGNGATAANSQLVEVLQQVATGVLTADDAAMQLSQVVGQSKLGAAEVPTHKAEFPEVVWGEGKTPSQLAAALQRIADRQGMAAATRVAPRKAAEVVALLPDATYNEVARMLVLKSATTKQQKLPGSVALICAGTADVTVVEECRLMLASCGCYAFKLAESGVMGMHRIVQNLDAVKAADVVICITGMDGGLASVVAGMVEVPVIALPTSTGYGTAFSGVAPMLAALNSSAPGVTVVNIDSGFGASMAAWRILQNALRIRKALTKA